MLSVQLTPYVYIQNETTRYCFLSLQFVLCMDESFKLQRLGQSGVTTFFLLCSVQQIKAFCKKIGRQNAFFQCIATLKARKREDTMNMND